jgi:hypothetical protein
MKKTRFLDRQALLNPNPHTITRVEKVLHKLKPENCERKITQTVIQPSRPFKCQNILIWCHQDAIIQQITIGTMENLVEPIQGTTLSPKNPRNNETIPYETIEQWFKERVLGAILIGIGLCPLVLNVCEPQKQITIQFEGQINLIALYGYELIGE